MKCTQTITTKVI